MADETIPVVPAAGEPAPEPAQEVMPPMVDPSDDEAEVVLSAYDVLGRTPEQRTEEEPGENGAAEGSEPGAGEGAPPTTKQEEPIQHPYYKSQEEVDRAFSMRLAAERKKNDPDLSLAREVKGHFNGMKPEDISKWIAERRAEDLGFTPDQYGAVYRPPQPEPEPEPALTPGPSPAGSEEVKAIVSRINDEAPALKAKYPDFDTIAFMKNNMEALTLLRGGTSLERVYMLQNVDKIVAAREAAAKAAGERETAERVKARNDRIPTPTKGTAGVDKGLDVAHMSDEEFARIEESVRRGNYVKLG